MEFIGLLICVTTIFIIYRKLAIVTKGKLINGEVVGLQEGAKGLYGLRGYSYRIRIEYEGNIYIEKSLETTVTASGYPAREARGYFNLSTRKQVSIKGNSPVIWWSLIAFVIGIMMCYVNTKLDKFLKVRFFIFDWASLI